MTIGDRIESLRKNLGMSRRVFGECLGVSESVIVNIEYERLRRPEQKESLYKLICKEFHIREEWLKEGIEPIYIADMNEDEYSRAVAEINIKDSMARSAILDYWHLSDEDKELFWKFCNKFLK